MDLKLTALIAFLVLIVSSLLAQPEIYFQAHRGAIDEAPENTIEALKHAWAVPGAVPEVDLRTTKDGIIICLHDTSLFRTTNAPIGIQHKNIKNINFKYVENLDAGGHFDERFLGEKIPTLDQVLALMRKKLNSVLYLDVKDVNLKSLKIKLVEYDLESRIIFVHGDQNMLKKFKQIYPKSRTMTWISGGPDEIKAKYKKYKLSNFDGIDQLQFHLKNIPGEKEIQYVLNESYFKKVKLELDAFDVQLQIRPFEFNPHSMRKLINIGINWYVADAPETFYKCIQKALVL
jgi:glycerophosphoryl diester phosphodiesterase